jgi:type IV secretory pathway VirB4 component
MGLFSFKKDIDTKKVIKEPNKKSPKNKKDKGKDIGDDLEEKIEIKEGSSNVLLKNKKTLKDIIAPEHIDFSLDHRYAVIGDKHLMKNMYVGITPNSANFASFLHGLFNYGTIDTSIHIRPIDNETSKAELSKLRTNLEMEYLDNGGSTNRADDMASKVAEARRLREEVRDGTNKIYEVAVQATIYEEDLRHLRNSADQLKETLSQQDIGLKSATYCQEVAFRSNKPLNENHLGEWHTFDKRSLACVFPFTSNNINHENGVPIGFNMDNGLPIFYDTFHRGLDNYNMVIFAKSGGGKSTFIKMLAARSSTLDKVQNICLDIEPEYREITEILGGVNITIAAESDTIINPFDVVVDIIENKVTGTTEEKILLSEKINNSTSILMTMARGQTDSNIYYGDMTRMIIKRIVQECFDDIGLTENPQSLYVRAEDRIVDGKILGGVVKKKMPTISIWYKKLEKQAADNTNMTYQPYFDYLLMVMSDFTKYKRGGFTCFDGQSTVELSYDIPFINFDISSLNEKSELGLAQHILCDFIWEQMVKRNVDGRKIRVLIDEAWRMVKIPEALEFLDKMFRRARKKNTSTVVISQQFHEFYGEGTKSIIKNADTKLFLPPDETSVRDIQEVFQLTEGEAEFLRTCEKGEGLFKVNSVSAKLSIEIPPVEFNFVETNQNARLEREVERQKAGVL